MKKAVAILLILIQLCTGYTKAQCTTGCGQSTTTNSMPGTNNFSNTFCITTLSTLTYNQNFDMNGGTTCIGPNVTFSSSGGNYNGNWTINNYGITSRNISLNSGQTFNNYGTFTGSLTLNGGTVVNYNGATMTPSSFTFNNGSLTNNSGGSFTSTASVTLNSGSTFVNNGTLSLNGLTLNSSANATLGGTSTINGSISNNGNITISGILTVTSNFNQNSSGTTTSSSGGQCNALNISGTIQGQGTYNGVNGLVLNKALSPACGSCMVNGATVVGTPANQITGATLTASANSISGTITNPGGSPAATHYIVLRRFGSAVTDQPTDYTTYAAGNTIGSSTVVAVNPISTLSFTDANTIASNGCGAYHYAVFPLNSNGTCGSYNRTVNATNRSSVTVSSTGGTVGTSKTICSGNTSGVLTLSGYVGTISRWEYAVSPFSSWTTIANTTSTYTSGALSQTTQFRAVVNAGTGCSDANSSAATITVNPIPNAPTGTDATRCGNGTVTLTATPGTGETIDWYAASSGGTALLSGNTSYTTSSLSSTTIYYAEARNTTTSCVSATRTAVTATVNPSPSVTLSNFTALCAGTTSTNLTYTSPVNSPDQYSIDWSSAANAAGLTDVSWATLSGGTIPVTGLISTAGAYAASILVRNSITGCTTDVSNGSITTCGTANENSPLTLTAPASGVFTAINFASYGTPTGSCGSFATSSCHASTSLSVVQNAALGNNSFTLTANNGTFGDPCVGTGKRLYIEALSTAQVLNIYAIPTVASVTGTSRCGTGSVTVNATASSGATIDWYAAASGGTALATGSTSYTSSISSTATYYAEARNTTAGCVSSSRTSVTATINSIPAAPTGTNNTRCGNGTVTLTATPGSGETIDWYAAASGGTALATGSATYTTGTISSSTIYYAEARNTTNGCISATRTAVTATVNPSPSVTLSNFTAICSGTTSTTLTYSSPVNSPDQYSIDWSNAANAAGITDVSWATLSSGVISISGLTTTAGNYSANIYVRNSSTGCQTDVSNGTATTCGTAAENASLTLTAPGSGVFSAINFASYGTPTGSCGSFAVSSCHSSTSLTVVQNAALGNNSFTLGATNAIFGDPCSGTVKRLYVEAVSSIQVLTINAAPTITASAGAARCDAGSLTLSATPSSGATTDWYAASSGGTALATGSSTYTTGSLSSTTTYYAEARNTTTSCLSLSRTAVTAAINSYPVAPTAGNADRCGTGTVTITATPGTGETIDWYAAASGGTVLVTGNTNYTTGSISSTTIYYAQARNTTTGCISQTRTAVTATVNTIPVAPAAGNATRCGTGTVTITATPGTGETIDWYAASSGGTALVTGNASYTTGSISANTNYYATARNTTTGCISATRTTVTATVNTVPAAPTAGNASRCGTGSVTLTATPGTGVTVDWYAAASGGTALATGTTSYATGSISSTAIYYAEARNSTSGCISTSRTAVTATINTNPAAPTGTSNSRCGTGTVALSATPGTGETIDWYAASSGGTALVTGNNNYTTGSISSTTIYYAEARNTTTGCISQTRTTVTATVNTIPATPTAGNAARCGTGTVTITATPATGETIDWYAASSGGTALVTGNTSYTTGSISANTNYYATARNTTTACISATRTTVTATVNTIPATPTAGNASRCGTGSVTLTATPGTGVTVDWYAAASGGTALATGTTSYTTGSLSATTTYYAEAINSTTSCISTSRTAVTATINSNPAAPAAGTNTRCGTGTVTITATPGTGETIDWYAAASGGTALLTGNSSYTTGSISSTTTYYAEARNTTTGCSSQTRTAVAANVNPSPSVTLSNFAAICSGTTSTSLTYSSPVNSPDQYSIDWSSAANAAGINDVSWTTLSGGTIPVTGLTTTAGTYAANIYVRNSTTGCQTDVSANSVVSCGTTNEGGSITLTAPGSGLFTAINFASYGTPTGSCGSFATSSCHSATSLTVVQNAGLGRNSFTITANNGTFTDPCVGTGKRLYIEAVSSAQILTINAAPTVTASSPATRCGTGSITISATPSSGAAIDWYAAASGGTALATASNSYTTSLSSTTTFYAEARNTTTGCIAAARTAVTATVTLPTISSFSPVNAGPGMSVVITGTNFTGATAVSFGGTAATSYTVNSATQITAVIAAGASGNVAVTTACGTATLSGFTFYPAPTITSFTPTSGYIGNTITITGTNFTGATTVIFGGTAAMSYTVVSSTTITAVLNAGATGSVAVTTPGGTATRTGFTYINATVWAGTYNNSWSNSGNWNNGVPTSTSLVVIPPVETYPTLSGTQSISSLLMDTATSLTISGSNTLTVTGNFTNNGTTSGSGSLSMGGSSAQTINGTGIVKNIIINNAAGVSISSGTNMMSVTGTLTPTAGTLTTNGKLTLKSDASGTARITQGSSSGNYISGTISWERYIPGRRSWRLISYPFTTTAAPTINASIQEGAGGNASSNPNPEYGTHITGGTTANGFDANPAGNPSMKEMSGSNWIGITSTSTLITSKPGFFIFVRGSRANNLSLGVSAPVDNTTLRGTGNIKQGNQSLSLSGSGWQLTGNPFPSPVNLNAMATTNSAVINNNFKFWDPKLGGTNNVGGYVTVSYNGSSYDYAPTPASSVSEFLQSGAAFFVDAKSSGTLNINEAHKSSGGSDYVFRPMASNAKLHINIKSVNSDGTKPVVDGVMIGYDENYDNAIDGFDATKLPSTMNENLSVKRDGSLLSIERRNEIIAEDTIFLNLNYMRVRSYQLEINGTAFDSTILSANLEDAEAGTVTAIDLSGNTVYDFSITPTFNPNRLRVVFKRKNLVVLPVTLTSITANKENKNILVSWETQNEANLSQYEIEKSADGNNFTKVADKPANNTANAQYNWTDGHAYNRVNFYRLKMIGHNGQFKYSSVVYVSMNNQGVITVYPNPVTNNTVQLLMVGQEKGNYKLNIYNSNGQRVSSSEFNFNGTDATKAVRLSTMLPKGIYNAEVALPSGKKKTIQIAVQ